MSDLQDNTKPCCGGSTEVYYSLQPDGSIVSHGTTAPLAAPLEIAAEPCTKQRLVVRFAVECTTKGTNLDQSRESCRSDWTVVTLPDNFVFEEKTFREGIYSASGSDNDVLRQFTDFIEIIAGTGLLFPRTVKVACRATSPESRFGENIGSRGWTKAHPTVEYFAYR
ncbi:hypothetical protein [Solidesulfovibrio sp.]